ncbi:MULTISPECIES: PRTRC system ParB family protein [Paraburkholderia]|uniref:PRTRC system ParB family protein n=1 Tax=Paraburkholderia TaxID=1822464 RepID=UPI0038B9CC0A
MQQQPTLSLKQITVTTNPRKYFDAAKMEELTASVREKGVIQPVVVRTLADGGFALVAGGRRYKAAMAAHGEDYEIPVVVKDIDEVEAKQLAIIENIQRADMSPAEEAIAAAEQVGLSKGDRDEVARIFGWSRATLDKRLALMNCSANVLEALTTQQILLGHAELLAALPKETQDKLLPVIIKESKSVAEVKKTIEQVACSLSAAIFDKTDCANCPHNSSTQGEMFGESIATGNCTNRTCFNEKTEKQLEAVAANLRDDFPVVRIVRAGDNHTRIQLAVEGPKGVGEEQAKACHACQNYGAAVSALPDSVGNVYKGQCFDTVCNMKMVAKRLQVEKAAAEPKSEAKTDGTGAAKAASKANGTAPSTTSNPPAMVVAESDRIKTYRVALWRKALRREVGQNPLLAQRYLVSIALAGQARCVDDSTMKGIWEKLTEEKIAVSDVAKAATSVAAADDAKLALAVTGVTVAAIQGLDVHHVTSLCRHHRLDLIQHWKLCKEFLELITKSEMMVVADELGIRAALGDEFRKVFGKSKAEVIEALLNVKGFDYTGKIPKVLKF